MRADPMSDVIDGQPANAFDYAYLLIDSAIERIEILGFSKLMANRLQPALCQFEESLGDSSLMRMAFPAGQHAKSGLFNRNGRRSLDLEEPQFRTGHIAEIANIAIDNFIDSHVHQFIETVAGRGYRFIGECEARTEVVPFVSWK